MMHRMHARRPAAALALLALLAACGGGGGDGPSGPTPSVTSVTLSLPTAPITVGGSIQLTANVAATGGASTALSAVSSNTAVATASVSGTTVTVTGVGAGTATITVSAVADPTKSATATVTVQPDLCRVGSATAVNVVGSTALNGSLASTDCTLSDGTFADVYRITLTQSTQLQLQLSASFDAYLVLYDADANVVAEDDDSAGGSNARIARTLAAGTYYVAATSYDAGAVGAYLLTLSSASGSTGTCTLGSARPFLVQPGPTLVNGELAASDCRLSDGSYADLYQIQLSSARPLQIDLTSSAVDAYLVLYDANGNVVVEDDDSMGGTNARIARTLGAGTYYVAATSYDANDTGPYTLTIGGGGGAPSPTACTTTGATFVNLTPSAEVDGVLSSTDCSFGDGSYADLYRIALTTTRTLTIEMSSTTVDAYLALYDANGVSLAEDDDSGDGANARLVVTLGPGTYYIAATSFDPAVTGAYRLTIR